MPGTSPDGTKRRGYRLDDITTALTELSTDQPALQDA
jgi:hypothetical protein